MKKQLYSLIACTAIGFGACNSDTKTAAESTDSTTTTNVTTTTSNSDYAAMADEFQRNSDAGKYMDAKTGKPIKISVDRTTGKKINAETNEPVTRYILVDDNDWWVYDWEGTRLGRAKLENDKVLYEGDNNEWVEYDVKWKNDGDENKVKSDDIKVKTEKDGDTKVKTDDKKVKVEEDGKVKEKDN